METNSETERQIFILKEMLNDYMHNKNTQITDVEMLSQLANVVLNFGLEFYEYRLVENIIDYNKEKEHDKTLYENPFCKVEAPDNE